jgi:hypothetical protein
VPSPIGYTGPKGSPGAASVVGLTGSSASSALANYHYAGVYQSVDVASGASVQWGQFQPTLGFNDFLTLGEMWVSSSDFKQAVEVGWTVSGENGQGDSLSHLFVFHWVDGNATCYDGCGWEQVSRTRYPGMVVALTREPQQVIYRYFNSAWWLWYQSEWIGFFPESLWDVSFASADFVQWYGEVAGAKYPKSQMGDGLMASESTAAFMTDLRIEYASDSESASVRPLPLSDPNDYGVYVDDAGFRFGGPGYNVPAACGTCASVLANCGSVDDGCGNALSCGTCTAPETCGGGSQPNVCALPDGGVVEPPWTAGYFDAGSGEQAIADAGATTASQNGSSGCSSSGAGGSLLVAIFTLGLLALGRRISIR